MVSKKENIVDCEDLVRIFVEMTFRVWTQGCGWGRVQEDVVVEELRELKERVFSMERGGIHIGDVSDDEEEFV